MSDQKIAIVTGGSRGIGRGICKALANLGWGIVVNFQRNRDAAAQTAELVGALGGSACLCQADVSLANDRTRLVQQTLDHFGRINMLVNNAGVAPNVRSDLLEADEESFDRVLSINLKGPYFLSQQVAREMIRLREQRVIPAGTIVNISSISAIAATVNRGDYCMSKAAMGMMTSLFATRLAEYNINVYEIRPGIIETDMTAGVKEKYDRLIQDGLAPIKRWGQPNDIGKAVSAIAADFMPFTTGQIIYVDGGFHLRTL